MPISKLAPGPISIAAFVGLAAAVVLGVYLRLDDPLSSPVMAAEDPYTHMGLVKEHVYDGEIDRPESPRILYPPGLHGLMAAVWAYTGTDLYQLFRLGPVLFGGLGILGIGFLLWRHDGPIAGVVGALAFALAPEAIFRTTMMAPTALDLAILPFFLFALLEVVLGRLAWAPAAATISLFLVFSHPWVLTLVAMSGLVFALAALAIPWPRLRGRGVSIKGLFAAVSIVGVGWGLSLSGCAGWCGSGFRDILPGGERLNVLGTGIALLALLPTILLALLPKSRNWVARARTASRVPPIVRELVSLVLAASLVAATIPAVLIGMPDYVDLPHMIGWPILLLAALGIIALPHLTSPVAYLGFGVFVATYPFVIYNPLDSAFWPHRTAVYLAMGLAILAGVAVGAAGRTVAKTLSTPHATAPRFLRRAGPVFAPFAVLLLAGSIGGAVYVATPHAYADGWYRLYRPCEHEGLEAIARDATARPGSLIITGDWRPKIVVAALVDDPTQVWLKSTFFTSAEERNKIMNWLAQEGRSLYVVVDGYLKTGTPDADSSFLDDSRWNEVGHWCSGNGSTNASVKAYRTSGAKT